MNSRALARLKEKYQDSELGLANALMAILNSYDQTALQAISLEAEFDDFVEKLASLINAINDDGFGVTLRRMSNAQSFQSAQNALFQAFNEKFKSVNENKHDLEQWAKPLLSIILFYNQLTGLDQFSLREKEILGAHLHALCEEATSLALDWVELKSQADRALQRVSEQLDADSRSQSSSIMSHRSKARSSHAVFSISAVLQDLPGEILITRIDAFLTRIIEEDILPTEDEFKDTNSAMQKLLGITGAIAGDDLTSAWEYFLRRYPADKLQQVHDKLDGASWGNPSCEHAYFANSLKAACIHRINLGKRNDVISDLAEPLDINLQAIRRELSIETSFSEDSPANGYKEACRVGDHSPGVINQHFLPVVKEKLIKFFADPEAEDFKLASGNDADFLAILLGEHYDLLDSEFYELEPVAKAFKLGLKELAEKPADSVVYEILTTGQLWRLNNIKDLPDGIKKIHDICYRPLQKIFEQYLRDKLAIQLAERITAVGEIYQQLCRAYADIVESYMKQRVNDQEATWSLHQTHFNFVFNNIQLLDSEQQTQCHLMSEILDLKGELQTKIDRYDPSQPPCISDPLDTQQFLLFRRKIDQLESSLAPEIKTAADDLMHDSRVYCLLTQGSCLSYGVGDLDVPLCAPSCVSPTQGQGMFDGRPSRSYALELINKTSKIINGHDFAQTYYRLQGATIKELEQLQTALKDLATQHQTIAEALADSLLPNIGNLLSTEPMLVSDLQDGQDCLQTMSNKVAEQITLKQAQHPRLSIMLKPSSTPE